MMPSRTDSDLVAVVDTSVASLWFRKRQPNAGRYLALVSGFTLALPSIAKAELLYGAYRGGWNSDNVTALRAFIDRFEPLPVEENTIEIWATLRNECRHLGIGNTENDAWIAATALSFNCALVSHDRDHFADAGRRPAVAGAIIVNAILIPVPV